MALIPWSKADAVDPFGGLFDMNKQLDRLAGLFAGRSGTPGEFCWMPAIEVSQDDKEVVVRAELPGLNKADVQLSLEDEQTLAIEGQRRRERAKEKDGLFRSELVYGAFSRSVALPAKVKVDSAKATYKRGVLEVRLPKSADSSERRIEVEWL